MSAEEEILENLFDAVLDAINHANVAMAETLYQEGKLQHFIRLCGDEMLVEIMSRSITGFSGAGGKTILHYAIDHASRNVRIIDLLIKSGADINQAANNGLASLHHAIAIMNADIVDKLIAGGADVNQNYEKSMSPLHFFITGGVRREQDEATLLRIAYSLINHKDTDICRVDEQGRTLLHWAVDSRKIGLIKIILRKACDIGCLALVNSCDQNGQTPLHLLFKKIQRTRGIFEQGERIVDYEPAALAEIMDKTSDKLLEIVHLLFDSGAFLFKDKHGETPLTYAQKFHYPQAILSPLQSIDIWPKEEENYANYIQWLPHEVLVGIFSFFSKPEAKEGSWDSKNDSEEQLVTSINQAINQSRNMG
ncbi:MAG: hypothetical protein K0R48_617 [Gammaproteobacteria bacterium]|jgi:ankyrin repeat protein|nr:hypothetical protein [Gammaproteobacteria bacterium]